MPDTTQTDYAYASGKDSYMDAQNTTTNYGSSTLVLWRYEDGPSKGDPFEYHPIMYADMSALGQDRVVREAYARIYVTSIIWEHADDNGESALQSRLCTRDNWAEASVCWLYYQGVNAWTVPGGDGASPYPSQNDGPTTTGWFNYNIGVIAARAHLKNAGICNWFGVMAQYIGWNRELQFKSAEHTDTADRPLLRVVHELEGRQVMM